MAVDVTILGAGVFGLSIAYSCAVRGARVRVIDPNGVASGASGGIVGALAPHMPDRWDAKKQFQFDSLILSRSYWPEVERLSGLPTGYTHAGRLMPVMQEKQLPLAMSRNADAATYWHGLAEWTVIPTAGAGDWAPVSPIGQMTKDTLSAHIHPRQATLALAAAIRALGGDITKAGARQGMIVEATGVAGLTALSEALKIEAGNGVKGQAALLEFSAQGRPQLFADGIHVVPHTDGTVAIGSTSERYFKSPTALDGQVDDLIAKAKRLFPVLKDAPVIDRWAGVRPRAITLAPLLGAHPVHNGWFMANGGFKIGFGMAPMVGQVMADLMLEGRDTIPAEFSTSALQAYM